MKHLNISLPEDLLYDLNFLYKFFLLRLKLLLYMVWDIDDYIGNKNFDYIVCAYDKEFKNFNIGCDYNIFDFIN
jgi:hypothetical protein